MNQKEQIFAEILIEVYKYFISDKVVSVPENCNFLDLAIKLSVQEITAQKNIEKASLLDVPAASDFNINPSSHSIQASVCKFLLSVFILFANKFYIYNHYNYDIYYVLILTKNVVVFAF